MTAIRSVRSAEGKFTQIANDAIRDRRLCGLARAIIALVLSMPPEQHLTAKWLEGQFPEGRLAIRASLRQLEECGYYRRTKTSVGGTWAWDQVISDAPIPVVVDGPESSQVAACGRNASDAFPSDAGLPDNRSNTEQPNTEETQEVSRRAHASGERADETRTVDSVVRDVRAAVTEVHGQQEADELGDDDALGLYFRYAHRKDVHNLVPYLVKILGDAPYLDAFLANSEPVCCVCVKYYGNCGCQAA